MTAISIDNNDNIDIIVAMKLHILVCDGVFDLGLAALTDTVGLANAMSGSLPQAPAHIELTLVGVRRRLRTAQGLRSEEHTSELQSLMRISYAVFCLTTKK